MNTLYNNRFNKILIIIFVFILYTIPFISCKEEAPVQPTPDPVDSLAVIIDGPTSSQMVDGDYKYVLQLDGSGSKNVKDFLWKKMGPDDVDFSEVGSQPTLVDTLRAIGEYNYRLVATSTMGKVDSTSFSLELNPLEYTNEIWAFRGVGGPNAEIELLTMDPNDFSRTVYHSGLENLNFDTGTLSRSPNGKELLVNTRSPGRPVLNLSIYNIESKTTRPLVQTKGNDWFGEFSPLGDYVAFCTDGRYSGHSTDELAIVNVSSGEITYFVPNTSVDKYFAVGQNPSWSPDGQEIAMGVTRDTVNQPQGKHVDRIFIYSDIYSDNRERKRLHSEEYLREYFGNEYGFDSLDVTRMKEGINYLIWSPDGSLLAYGLGLDEGVVMAIAHADGSGIVNIIHPKDLNQYLFLGPTWSSDSQTLAFAGLNPPHVYTSDRQGNNVKDVTPTETRTMFNLAWGK